MCGWVGALVSSALAEGPTPAASGPCAECSRARGTQPHSCPQLPAALCSPAQEKSVASARQIYESGY